MLSADYLHRKGVTFYFPEKEFHPENVHYAAECLASGLKQQGLPLFANIDHGLFQKREIAAFTDGVLVFYVTEKNYSEALMAGIVQFKAPYKIILSMADTNSTILTPQGVPSLMTHESRFMRFKAERQPWAFGLSQQRIKAAEAEGEMSFSERKPMLIRNFRPSYSQSVRNALDLVLLPHLAQHFQIDGAIAPDHFHRLSQAVGCLAYGGHFVSDLSANSYFAGENRQHDQAKPITYLQESVVARWDSWRFWESLATGCLTFQLDFEKYGLYLPVTPKPWEEYIPIDFSDPKGTVEHLMDLKPRWAEIAANGRRWALTHYAPESTARRFLAYVQQVYPR